MTAVAKIVIARTGIGAEFDDKAAIFHAPAVSFTQGGATFWNEAKSGFAIASKRMLMRDGPAVTLYGTSRGQSKTMREKFA